MKKTILLLLFASFTTTSISQTAKRIVIRTIKATGGKKNYYNLGNVNYDLEYRTPPGKGATTLVANETYVFDGERSHSAYKEHSILGGNGNIVEGYNSEQAWVTFDGKISSDEKANGVAHFLRKTNYFWFSMIFKLLDDGVNHERLSDQKVNGENYYRVKITFDENVGDTQDTFVIYVNKRTKLIDQFLFTVVAFGLTEPNLMITDTYEIINNIKIPSKRKYVKSDWEGNINGEKYSFTNWTNIKFNNTIDNSLFEK